MLAPMRIEVMAATAATILLGLSVFYGCGDDEGGQQLTTVSSGPGTGGNAGPGGAGGDGGNPSTGGNPSAGGMGGMGGNAEQPIHGCTSTSATDMTGMANVDLGAPLALTWPVCRRVSLNTTITVSGSGTLGDPLIVGGTFDGAIKSYDASSPIQPSCATGCTPCQFDPNASGCYTGGSWTFTLAGVYPFYDNSDPGARAGVIYVVP